MIHNETKSDEKKKTSRKELGGGGGTKKKSKKKIKIFLGRFYISKFPNPKSNFTPSPKKKKKKKKKPIIPWQLQHMVVK